MTYLEQLHSAHVDRRARIAAKAVPDEGINLKRKLEPPVPPEPEPCTPHNCLITDDEYVAQFLTDAVPRKNFVADIQRTACVYYNVTLAELCERSRRTEIARRRQIVIYLCKKLTNRSLPEIGRHFGGMDHTTILHAVRKIEALRSVDGRIDADVVRLRHLIERGGPAPEPASEATLRPIISDEQAEFLSILVECGGSAARGQLPIVSRKTEHGRRLSNTRTHCARLGLAAFLGSWEITPSGRAALKQYQQRNPAVRELTEAVRA